MSKVTILIVEDDLIIAAHISAIVKQSDYNVSEILTKGESALDYLSNNSVDVILMDIHMPIKDGIETTIAIRNSQQDWADVIIIALTADPDYQQLRICRNIGMDGTLGKPVKRREIMQVIEDVLMRSDDVAEKENAA